MRIKVCGVTRPADARLAARLGAWAVGMIFVPDTPRALTLSRAKRVRAAIPKGVLAVGVFRNPSPEVLSRYKKELRLDGVQIYAHGRCVLMTSRRRLVLIEPPRTDADRRKGRAPSARARRAARLKAAVLRRRGTRVILAGGLTPENAAEAAAAKPFALDVSSGVEKRPGVKDARLLRAFFAAARRA
ncbi:MAG: phosphoribosylanthranilate isomerase [Elusimicrobia bacterium]|nr:phosphoribosylanthranilate isomerase [Elusimicrobiota bacterium]